MNKICGAVIAGFAMLLGQRAYAAGDGVAGITVTAGGVLFTGDLDDNFLAIDANTGKTLYSFNTGGSVGGGVISYEVGGKQFVAAMSGQVSGFFGGNGPAAVVVFALR
jgi:alcohol dehydrogenase (cytochrome c)